MNIWDSISKSMNAWKGNFLGTSGNEAKISRKVDKGKSVNISNPTSQRTFHRDASGSLLDQQIDIGNTGEGDVGEVVSSAIKNARYDPSDNSLNITYRGGDKEYKFAATPEDVKEWMNAPSKGQITQSWTKKGSDPHTYPGY